MKSKKLTEKKVADPDFFAKLISNIIAMKWIVLFFVIFFVAQLVPMFLQQWDSQAYIFGGKWFCGNQVYFEFIRPPLPSFLNCVFGANDYSILLSTALACFAYLAAIILIYKKNSASLNQFIFALFAFLFPAILFNSNYGSDLLALAFVMLAFSLDKPIKKGFFFALASLSRYNFLLFGLVFLFELRKKPKDILSFLSPLVILWIPWMVYNYLFTGNPFFSIAESSFLNIAQKGVIAPISIDQLFVILFFLALVFFLDFRKKIQSSINQAGVLSAVMFALSGIKETRFINLLSPVIAFNAALFAGKDKKKTILLILIFIIFFWFSPKPGHTDLIVPEDQYLKDCRVASDKWVFFYDSGIIAECIFDISSLKEFVSSGGNLVIYDYKDYNISNYGGTVIQRDEYVIIKSDSCTPQPKKYISGSLRNSVIKWLKDTNSTIYDYSDWVE